MGSVLFGSTVAPTLVPTSEVSGVATLSHDLVIACLMLTIAGTYKFPIHIGRSTTITLYDVPLYLIAVLVSPVPAAIAGGIGMLIAELMVREQRKTYYIDVITTASRLTLVTLLTSCIAHLPMPTLVSGLPMLVLAAITMWLSESLTAPLVVAPIVCERPFTVFRNIVRENAVMEGAQYLLAILCAMAATAHLWAGVLFVPPIVLTYRHFKRVKELQDDTRKMLEELADVVDRRDAYTGSHSRRVATLTEAILSMMPADKVERDLIVWAARMHDIGKVEIDQAILQKPGPLTTAEQARMEQHPVIGANLLQPYPGFARGVEIVRHHHEAWDGSGYPAGLKGETIPFGARVIAVADSYDAMTSDRPYRRGLTPAQAVARLMQGRDQQWDPAVIDALLRARPELADYVGIRQLRALPNLPPETPVPLAIAR